MSTTGSGTDYVNVPSTVSIPAGAASVYLTFTPVDDALVEGASERSSAHDHIADEVDANFDLVANLRNMQNLAYISAYMR